MEPEILCLAQNDFVFMPMKNVLNLVAILFVITLLPACVTIQPYSFERLQAADVNYPEQVRKVGIIGYMPVADWADKEIDYSSSVCEGDGKVVVNALANEIAATEYFDEVVVCDSVLHQPDESLAFEGGLPKELVDSLVQVLGVDMLFSVERVNVRLLESSMYVPELVATVPAIDGIVTPVIKTYTSGRKTPMFSVSKSDTICWEITPVLTLKQMVKDASEYAASMAVEHLLPHWKEIYRYYYDGGNMDMRDAGVYVREQNWEAASALWQKVFEAKKGKTKMYAAFNLALFHELKDDFVKAKEYLDEASRLAGEGSSSEALIRIYQLQLDEQAKKNLRLQMQMGRFQR